MCLNNVIQYILRKKRQIWGIDEIATGGPVSLDNQKLVLFTLPPKGKTWWHYWTSFVKTGIWMEKLRYGVDRSIRHPAGLCKLGVNVNIRNLWAWFLRKTCAKAVFRTLPERPLLLLWPGKVKVISTTTTGIMSQAF